MTSIERLEDVTLRAKSGTPLADERTADVVEATAHAIAERTGVVVLTVQIEGDAITATLRAPTIVAIGFAAELRRLTERWYNAKHGTTLWGEVSAPGTDIDPDVL